MDRILYNNEIAYATKYDGYYVTKSGKVITIKVKGGHGSLDYNSPREHYYKTDKDGYLEVRLSIVVNGIHKRKYIRVHRLVYETIVGEIPQNLTIDHIDANRVNNRIENLQLLSREDNTRKALKNKASPKRYIYDLYLHDVFIGKFDRKGLQEYIGLQYKDFYRNSNRKRELLLQGYRWNLESVEDSEKIS